MGFETQEQAERWAEAAEFAADQRREEKMLAEIEAVTDYNRIALDACHKRIAELERALAEIRAIASDSDTYGALRIFKIAVEALK